MTSKRKRHERSWGTTSQAYNCTPYSRLCKRSPSSDRKTKRYPKDYETEFLKRYHLQRKNLDTLQERKILVVMKWMHRYYIAVQSDCEEYFKEYCLYLRKNHPAKKGLGKRLISEDEMNVVNRQLYPQWF